MEWQLQFSYLILFYCQITAVSWTIETFAVQNIIN